MAAAAVLPSALQALEQKTLALQLTSVRFSLIETISGSTALSGLLGNLGKSGGGGKTRAGSARPIPLIEANGDESFAPMEGSVDTSFLGSKARSACSERPFT